jgi:hypothetical protein
MQLVQSQILRQGFVQQLHVHFEDVWAPTAHYATLRLLFALSIERSLTIRHVDVKCAFLKGSLNEQLFMEQPEILNDGNPQHVWRLNKALYGLKQAGRQWHMYLKDVMTELNFRRAGYDPALFISADSEQFVLMWVDDLCIVDQPNACDKFTTAVIQHFESCDLGEARWLLGMVVQRDNSTGALTLSHSQMIEKMLKRYGLEACKPSHIPMEPINRLVLIRTENPASRSKTNY